MQATKTKQWAITDYSLDIQEAAIYLNTEYGMNITIPYDAPSEYATLKECRKHWQKLKKGGISLIKEKDYPQIRQIEKITTNHWRCINHSKCSIYEITKDGHQFNCTCPASVNGVFCSHVEALLNSPVYEETQTNSASLNEALTALKSRPANDREVLFPTKGMPPVAPWDMSDDELIDEYQTDDELSIEENGVDSGVVESIPCPGEVQPEIDCSIEGKSDIFSSSSSSFEVFQFLKGETNKLMLPNGFEATSDQGAAFRSVWNWAFSDDRFYVISGFAGSGKTSLLELLVRELPFTRIAIVATTNKAVKVARAKTPQVEGKVIHTMTVAKLLGIRPSRYGDSQAFEKDPNAESLVSQYGLVIPDECSTIGQNAWGWLLSEMNALFSQSTKCLAMGDIAQLPPVLEDTSLTFTDIKNSSTMTEVIRNEGAVLEWCTHLRENLTDHRIVIPQTSFNEDKTKGICVLDRKTWESTLVKAFKAAKEKGKPADSVRALAWTNKRVDKLNATIRAAINPRARQFEIGDHLIVKVPFCFSAFGDEPDQWLQTSDELIVDNDPVPGEVEGVRVWLLSVRTPFNQTRQIPVVQAAGIGRYKQREQELKESKRFDDLWGFRESFCQVAYAWALTIHNSQGSTFQDVFIDMKDVAKCKDRTSLGTYLRGHLGYVGFSRASHRVFACYE